MLSVLVEALLPLLAASCAPRRPAMRGDHRAVAGHAADGDIVGRAVVGGDLGHGAGGRPGCARKVTSPVAKPRDRLVEHDREVDRAAVGRVGLAHGLVDRDGRCSIVHGVGVIHNRFGGGQRVPGQVGYVERATVEVQATTPLNPARSPPETVTSYRPEPTNDTPVTVAVVVPVHGEVADIQVGDAFAKVDAEDQRIGVGRAGGRALAQKADGVRRSVVHDVASSVGGSVLGRCCRPGR